MSAREEALPGMGMTEFIAGMALTTAMVALSIDMMLPALPSMGAELGAPAENDQQLIISSLFLGMALALVFYGPMADAWGRKRTLFIGMGLYLVGTVIALAARDFTVLIAARVLQGIGVAGPRVAALAITRDLFVGRRMARVTSLIMMVFILVPVIAPALGQLILYVTPWRGIFVFMGLMGVGISFWIGLRMPETLPADRRAPFSLARSLWAMRETVTNRAAFGYTLCSGAVFAGLISYLSTAQQVLGDLYGLGDGFVLVFGAIALVVGGSSFVNSRLVERLGMRRLSHGAMMFYAGLSILFTIVAVLWAGKPPYWLFIVYLTVLFGAVGLVFANMQSMAMEPMGHVAGVASGVINAISSLIAAILGALAARAYDGTVTPLVAGFAVFGCAALLLARWAEGGREALD